MNTQNLTPSIFNFNAQPLRSLVIADRPWFVAKDLCDILEIKNSRDVVRRALDGDEWTVSEIPTPSRGSVRMQIVSQSGMYALVFKSRKPEAKAFRKWVTNDVLPELMKTGSYTRPAGAKEVTRPVGNPTGSPLHPRMQRKEYEERKAQPAPKPKQLPASARPHWDARHLAYDWVRLKDGQVRCIQLHARNWYSASDVLQAIGTRFRNPYKAISGLAAEHRHLIHIYGLPCAMWFVNDTGLRMMLAARRMLHSQLTINLD